MRYTDLEKKMWMSLHFGVDPSYGIGFTKLCQIEDHVISERKSAK
jgi:hypothetical protein